MGNDNPNAEAARYRRRLRDTEAERDLLAAKLVAVTRQQVEAVAARYLPAPGLLWRLGVDPADLVADDGTVDADKVNEVAKATADEFGITTAKTAASSAFAEAFKLD